MDKKLGMYCALVADDEDGFRDLLRSMVNNSDKLTVVGEANTGREALGLIQRLSPDLVISDIYMPDMDGLDMTRAIRDSFPHVKVILVSGYTDRAYERLAIEAGALAFIPKTRLSPEALHHALQGEARR